MASVGLSSGAEFLREAARKFFANAYQNPTIHVASEIDPKLSWKPSLHFKINEHLMVIAEVSETPYPMIFGLRRSDVLQVEIPISIYCVCPEEAYLADQASAKRLMAHGFGLLTVGADGTVQKRSNCIPLVQQISDLEFKAEISGLPAKCRQRIAEAFERYTHNAPSGVSDITEIVEGFILKAGKDAAKKGWIKAAEAKPGAPAATLAAMAQAPQFGAAMAAIGGAQSYISLYRNTAHHFPKNKKQAHRKYRDCRHAFLDGIKKIQHFREAMKNAGLSGTL
ncbi:hypothetical protein ACFYE9_23790 [Rhizobium leguminosarum]|uniref:Uncharacterized protein n=2 Tax=Rhizobium leguminosarum TaxID=384 RepID=A0A154I7H8_RHILE|nr:hypothetical protein [Rhizobium leguminosarum]KZA96496.1 hypothetical protein A4A59_05220 [Rhizobium leguminosarum]